MKPAGYLRMMTAGYIVQLLLSLLIRLVRLALDVATIVKHHCGSDTALPEVAEKR